MIKITVNKGEEILEKVTKVLKEKSISAGSISVIGALDSCSIATMSKHDAKKNIITEYHEPLEVSGVGEIIEGEAHIHITLGREDKTALFGHLRWGKVSEWFVHVYLTPFENNS